MTPAGATSPISSFYNADGAAYGQMRSRRPAGTVDEVGSRRARSPPSAWRSFRRRQTSLCAGGAERVSERDRDFTVGMRRVARSTRKTRPMDGRGRPHAGRCQHTGAEAGSCPVVARLRGHVPDRGNLSTNAGAPQYSYGNMREQVSDSKSCWRMAESGNGCAGPQDNTGYDLKQLIHRPPKARSASSPRRS